MWYKVCLIWGPSQEMTLQGNQWQKLSWTCWHSPLKESWKTLSNKPEPYFFFFTKGTGATCRDSSWNWTGYLQQIYIYNWAIGLMSRVFANGLGDLGSIPGRVIPKTQKMVPDAALLNTQHYKVRIKGKVEQSRE